MKVSVRFKFLEKRDYIHSTSFLYSLLDELIKNGIIKNIYDVEKVNAVFRKKSIKHGYFIINENIEGVSNFSAILRLKDNSEIKAYYVETDENVVERTPYDEDELAGSCVININNLSAEIPIENTDNIYNVLVALNKKLLLKLYEVSGYSSWSVGKFSINWAMLHKEAKGNILAVKVTNNIDNMYIKSAIYVGNVLLGNIDYARKRV